MVWRVIAPDRTDSIASTGKEVLIHIFSDLPPPPPPQPLNLKSPNYFYVDHKKPRRKEYSNLSYDENNFVSNQDEFSAASTDSATNSHTKNSTKEKNGTNNQILKTINDHNGTGDLSETSCMVHQICNCQSIEAGSTSSGNFGGHNTHDSEFDYDDEKEEEEEDVYERVVMKVSPKGGMITLEYPENSILIKRREVVQTAAEKDDIKESSITTCNNDMEPESPRDKTNLKEEEEKFELIPTNCQRSKDKWLKDQEKVRNAVLRAALKAYKKSKFDVPLCITNELNRNTDLRTKERANVTKQMKKEEKKEIIKEKMLVTDRKETNKYFPDVPIKRLILREDDEIHASPCQCALSLVGLSGSCPPPYLGLFPSFSSNSNFSTSHESKSSGTKSTSQPTTNATYPAPDTTHKRKMHLRMFKREHGLGMVRTASGKATDTEAVATTSTAKTENNSGKLTVPNGADSSLMSGESDPEIHRRKIKRKSVVMFPKTNSHSESSPCYKSFGYHEITLLRSSDSSYAEVKDFIPWRALTIRCRDHDEMDLLIRALRESSRAKVIPFSSNPRTKLKRAKAENKLKKCLHSDNCRERGVVSHHSSHSSAKAKSGVRNTPKHEKVSKSTRKNQFNNKDQCELCGFHFTLLTRRHHCRKCDSSCCGDCSTIMLVRGGEQTRFCNRCNAKIIFKEFTNRRRLSNGDSLPGKVHEQCKSLGVGVMGKLPHWKNFLLCKPSRRPAVGRLTIEVIEALALPAVDLNGKSDPYVRATITGYDRDLEWIMREWLPSKRFSLCTYHCSATLSPVWRGPGILGGELLTLPVLSTAGAVLRLEVLHYDIITNARGKDPILRVVEIPLSDIPNANLRQTNTVKPNRVTYDGFVDRWYKLQSSQEFCEKGIMLAKPIENPQFVSGSEKNDGQTNKTVKLSWQEISKRAQGFCFAPVQWVGSVLGIDVPRHPTVSEEHRFSAIHVRLKLNSSEVGDLLSHSWLPPVQLKQDKPPYDPETLFSTVMRIHKQIAPYCNFCKFCEDAIKWRHPTKICIASYLLVAFHIFFVKQFSIFLHVYLLSFMLYRLQIMVSQVLSDKKKTSEASCGDSNNDSTQLNLLRTDSFSFAPIEAVSSSYSECDSVVGMQVTVPDDINNKEETNVSSPPSNQNLTQPILAPSSADSVVPISSTSNEKDDDNKEEEKARLNVAVRWIAKKFGENKGLEVLQFKLALFERDVTNLNSLWNGTSILKTMATITALIVSLILHFYVGRRKLWMIGTATGYFCSSPGFLLLVRFFLGMNRGIAQVVRRRHLHNIEMQEKV